MVVTNVEDENIYSGTVLNVHCLCPIVHRKLYNLHVLFSLAFCCLFVLFRCILLRRLVDFFANHLHGLSVSTVETISEHAFQVLETFAIEVQ